MKNWAPYLIGATEAILNGEPIEKWVKGHVHGNSDMSAGFECGWVELLDLNPFIVPEGTQELVDKAIDDLIKGKLKVFSGNYIGVNPADPSDTIDLTAGYKENENTSYPTFHYILRDYITIE